MQRNCLKIQETYLERGPSIDEKWTALQCILSKEGSADPSECPSVKVFEAQQLRNVTGGKSSKGCSGMAHRARKKDPSGLSKIAQGATPHFLIFNRPLLLRASFLDALLSVYPREKPPTLAQLTYTLCLVKEAN